jgi:hypothetical protein
MKKIMSFFILSAVLLFFTSFSGESGWIKLLDKNLNNWETYLSYRFQDGYNGSIPVNAKGEKVQPIGYNKNEANVISVAMENNEPVLRISGEIYGCVFTKQEFENYDLKLKVKWGTLKWEPRKKDPKDSGLLYHSQGECGVDYWHSWMQSEEFQIMEGGFGDYWCCAATGAHVKMHDPGARNDMGIYDPNGIDTPMGVGGTRTGFVQHSQDFEKPGEWNSVELICFGDKSIHIVNGHVVMALSKMVYKDGDTLTPLVKGRIQLQSEASEVFYKEIEIRKINNVPAEYKSYFK